VLWVLVFAACQWVSVFASSHKTLRAPLLLRVVAAGLLA
jgi:hypothetical protein